MTAKRFLLLTLILFVFTRIFGQTIEKHTYRPIFFDEKDVKIESPARITLFDSLGNTYQSDTNFVANLEPHRSYIVQIQLNGYFSIEKKIYLNRCNYIDTLKLSPINTHKSMRIFVESSTHLGFDEKVLKNFLSSIDCNFLRITIDESYLLDSNYCNLVQRITRMFLSLHNSNYTTINLVYNASNQFKGIIELSCETSIIEDN